MSGKIVNTIKSESHITEVMKGNRSSLEYFKDEYDTDKNQVSYACWVQEKHWSGLYHKDVTLGKSLHV